MRHTRLPRMQHATALTQRGNCHAGMSRPMRTSRMSSGVMCSCPTRCRRPRLHLHPCAAQCSGLHATPVQSSLRQPALSTRTPSKWHTPQDSMLCHKALSLTPRVSNVPASAPTASDSHHSQLSVPAALSLHAALTGLGATQFPYHPVHVHCTPTHLVRTTGSCHSCFRRGRRFGSSSLPPNAGGACMGRGGSAQSAWHTARDHGHRAGCVTEEGLQGRAQRSTGSGRPTWLSSGVSASRCIEVVLVLVLTSTGRSQAAAPKQ